MEWTKYESLVEMVARNELSEEEAQLIAMALLED